MNNSAKLFPQQTELIVNVSTVWFYYILLLQAFTSYYMYFWYILNVYGMVVNIDRNKRVYF